MSIDNDLQPSASITEGDRALNLFTDRYSFTRLLAERLNDPPEKKILFFHGAGGNGKSLLLKYLRTKICKGLTAEQWQRAKEKPDDELAKALEDLKATQCLPVPTALLDFAPGSSRRDSDPFYGLVRIREELAASTAGTPYRLKFPLHTYGCFLYLQKTNRLSDVDKLFPFEEAGLINDFIELFQSVPTGVGFGLSALKLVDKYSGQRLTHYKRRFGLNEAAVNWLQGMDAESELLLELPRLLAQDLNVAMERTDGPSRVVLFFDTHEAFYGSERDHSKNFFRDGWLRRLLRKLDTAAGVVVVVAGRDRPRWAEAGAHELNTQIPVDYVCLKSVDDLVETDADIFLRRAGVEDAALRESLIRYASVEAGRVHPLHLGLCADVVLEATVMGVALVPGDFSGVQAFQEKSAYLIEQLLKYVDEGLRDAIRALSACRAFDFEIYQVLGEKLSFATDRATFRRLVGFSFIRQVAQRGDEWFRIHDLLRRLGNESRVAQAHEILAVHYQEKGEIESIYHVNRLDWSQGVDLWIGVFNEFLKVSRYDLCRALLDLRQELTIRTPLRLGQVSKCEGQYFQILALYENAKQEYEEGIRAYTESICDEPDNIEALDSKGSLLSNLADLQTTLSAYEEARKSYQESIEIYDVALRIEPKAVLILLNNKGISLKSLADLQRDLSEHEAAQITYAKAIATYDAVLREVPDSDRATTNKGLALSGLANLQAALSKHRVAQTTYIEAINTYNAALQIVPDFKEALCNKGSSLRDLADLQVVLSDHEAARVNYAESISTYSNVLLETPEDVEMFNNKGISLLKLAELQAMLSEYEAARNSYYSSIKMYDETLRAAPAHVGALNNKGNTLQSLANLQTRLSEYDLAQTSYVQSILVFDLALQRSSKSVIALNNKGISLLKLAVLQMKLSDYQAARENSTESIRIFDTALNLAPSYVDAINNKGNSLRVLADLHVELLEYEAARASYARSIAVYDIALQHSPAYLMTLDNKGNGVQSLADLQVELSEHEAALTNYAESIAIYDTALQYSPDDITVLNDKGNSLQKLADLQTELSEYETAQAHYTKSISAYDAVLLRSPNDVPALTNKGNALWGLADLQVLTSDYEHARKSFADSIAIYDMALQLAPEDIGILENKENVLKRSTDLQSITAEPEGVTQRLKAM